MKKIILILIGVAGLVLVYMLFGKSSTATPTDSTLTDAEKKTQDVANQAVVIMQTAEQKMNEQNRAFWQAKVDETVKHMANFKNQYPNSYDKGFLAGFWQDMQQSLKDQTAQLAKYQ